jgi:hypothetical protein
MKHPKLTLGYTSLRASIFTSAEDIKHTLTLASNSNTFWMGS